ncbi:hypothetical protein [uncultured Eubacterium sp.]|uniref:hypothetical protein n=1 Tax=uncultured Eubacterium sp. TaxID=165185 RepID=UPI002595E154|nr:hypothetical protein [uncultured Eubacterium sp.]
MNQIEKIDYMIQSLRVAKDEIEYGETWQAKKNEQGDGFYKYSGFGNMHRVPNGTIMRESLRMVGRMANQVANEITFTSYCDELFKERGEK